ncbi:MAG: hypothetical protein ABIS47_08760 [Acidimicrobiales bacterium]
MTLEAVAESRQYSELQAAMAGILVDARDLADLSLERVRSVLDRLGLSA